MTMVHDLLTEPLLSWRDGQRRRAKTTLPGLLEKLGSGELGDFPKVRTHQLHPWAMFLTQLAAIALRRAGKSDPRASEGQWREWLLGLTAGAHEPWCLVVEDLSKPAFFQPPVPEESKAWKVAKRPDHKELDVLVLAKSHDVKMNRVGSAEPESWVYPLVTLQTSQGYAGGAGGYKGIARMNSGYGSRSRIGLAEAEDLATRFRRDVRVHLDSWEDLLSRGYSEAGTALLWLPFWDGTESLPRGQLSPHFIEICRLLRMRIDGGGFQCAYGMSSACRCSEGMGKGDVGDAWTPVHRAKGTALSVKEGGFDYRVLADLLFDDVYEAPAALRIRSDDPSDILFNAAALARGQSETAGLHQRTLVLPAEARRRLHRREQREEMGKRAAIQVERAQTMRSKVLFPALSKIALGEKVVPDRLDRRVDEVFFENLFGTLELDDAAAQLAWEQHLVAIARDELQRATGRCCLPDARRYRAIAAAESKFRDCLTKHFPDLVAAELAARSQPQEGAQP